MEVAAARSVATDTLTPQLLRAGAAAAPLYIVVGLAQVLTREGFDVRRHALSLLGNGELGWIQVGNFLLAGVLVIAGAAGVRLLLRGRPWGTWGPVLLALYGVGLIGSGIFVADPGAGFPPGSAPPPEMTRSGLLHFVFGGIGFYALIGACFVFARRYARRGARGWSAFSALTGVGFFLAFAWIASGSTSAATILTFYAAVAWIWIWHTVVLLDLLRQARVGGVEAVPAVDSSGVA